MKKNDQIISVLLPVYNAESFLERTLDSLFYQTYKNFEIIAINDGSTDGSLEILHRYAAKDSRLVVVDQENCGLVKTLNKAAQLAKGEFLARMDSDDISLPRRFELQMNAFQNHTNTVLVAGGFDVMDEDDDILYHDPVPTQKEELRRALFVRNPIAHGSVMFKKQAFIKAGGYSEECGPTEDYELWSRLIEFGDFTAVAPTIFRWRINSGGITQTKAKLMSEHMKINLARFAERNTLEVTPRSYLMKRGRYYIQTYKQHGIGMKHTLFKDCTSIAMLFMRKKEYWKGIKQFYAVASTGRTGLTIVRERLTNTSKYYIKTYANKNSIPQTSMAQDE